MYKEFMMQLQMYAKVIRILAKGYLPISLITPLKLHEILDAVMTVIRKTNPDYDIVIKRLHLDMKLVTFGIGRDKNLVIQFPVFMQPYTQPLLLLYQIETIPVLIIDQNQQTDSYTHLQIDIPYIALNSKTDITIRQQECRTCKRIGYEFCCKELFMVKLKSRYSCEIAMYLDLGPDVIKENHKFSFYYFKTDITPRVLDGGNEIILANWLNDKQMIYNVNNNIPVKIHSHP